MSKAFAGHADVTQFRSMVGKTSTLSPKLKAQLRKEFRTIGGRVVADIQNVVRRPPMEQGTSGAAGTGLREDLASNVKMTLSTGANAGIVIAERMNDQAHPRGLAVGYGKMDGWRHPIFGTDVWVQQKGRPYFKPVIDKRRGEVNIAVRRAMVNAAKQALT